MEESLFQEKLAEYTELVKDVDIEDVCEYEGIEVKNIRGHKQILCPFHNDQNYGSCFIKNNRIHCFSCGESADSIHRKPLVCGRAQGHWRNRRTSRAYI